MDIRKKITKGLSVSALSAAVLLSFGSPTAYAQIENAPAAVSYDGNRTLEDLYNENWFVPAVHYLDHRRTVTTESIVVNGNSVDLKTPEIDEGRGKFVTGFQDYQYVNFNEDVVIEYTIKNTLDRNYVVNTSPASDDEEGIGSYQGHDISSEDEGKSIAPGEVFSVTVAIPASSIPSEDNFITSTLWISTSYALIMPDAPESGEFSDVDHHYLETIPLIREGVDYKVENDYICSAGGGGDGGDDYLRYSQCSLLKPDMQVTSYNTPITFNVLENDIYKEEEDSVTRVFFLNDDQNEILDEVVVDGGVFTHGDNPGDIVFTPNEGFSGQVPNVKYYVVDTTYGQVANSTFTVNVSPEVIPEPTPEPEPTPDPTDPVDPTPVETPTPDPTPTPEPVETATPTPVESIKNSDQIENSTDVRIINSTSTAQSEQNQTKATDDKAVFVDTGEANKNGNITFLAGLSVAIMGGIFGIFFRLKNFKTK